MLDSPIIGLAIGLSFLFAVLATFASAVTEAIARFLGLRGAFLLSGLRSLVDGDDKAAGTQLKELFTSPVLSNQGTKKRITSAMLSGTTKLSRAERRALPSYISAKSFAAGVLDLVVPDATGNTEMDTIVSSLSNPPQGSKVVAGGIFQEQLLSLAKAATGDVDRFRASIEAWYDDHMDRVTGWYKRYTRWITAAVGAVLVIGLNVQMFAFAQSLYTDQSLGQSVVSKAVAASDCKNKDPGACIVQARKQLQTLQPGLTLGWGVVADCQPASAHCSFWQAHGFTDPQPKASTGRDVRVALTVILGWLLTIFALLPGSRFWFDLINQFNSISNSGPKPKPAKKRCTASLVATRWPPGLPAFDPEPQRQGSEGRHHRWLLGGGLLQQLLDEGDRVVQLHVPVRGPVLRRGHHLDVRVDTVVLDAPAELLEPEREPRLGHRVPSTRRVSAVDPDHAAPGPGADDRPELERPDRGGDDVAVGAGVESVTVTIGPRRASPGYDSGWYPRDRSQPMILRASFSSTSCDV